LRQEFVELKQCYNHKVIEFFRTKNPDAIPTALSGIFQEREDAARFDVLCPHVGKYYLSPSENTEPYVQLGDTVSAGQVLCRIHGGGRDYVITSPRAGIVRERSAEHEHLNAFKDAQALEDGFPVQYGQALFVLESTPEDAARLS